MSAKSAAAIGLHRLLGVAFLVLLVLFVWLTYAIFTKQFVSYVPVTLQTSKIGLQLPMRADVKVRGLIVGEVVEINSTGSGAELELAIQPERAHLIPANTTAQILPKTLFGEKYVALQVPANPAQDSISRGDVIRQSEVAIEVEELLTDLHPFLRTVQPADLNYTLNAMATALEGRGEAIGENLVILDDYLRRTNPEIPGLIENLRNLDQFSEVYSDALPDLARTLRNSVRVGETWIDREQQISALFADVSDVSSTSKDFLETNGDNIIRLNELSATQLRVLGKYAPEYPCLLQGMLNWVPQMAEGWRGHTLHITLEILPNHPTGYTVEDMPRFGAKNGPHCETLPTPPYDQSNPGPQPPADEVDDGVESGHGKHRETSARPRVAPAFDPSSGFAGSLAEQAVVNSIVAPVLGVPTDEVPGVATLLFGPLARGTEVSVR